MIRHALPGGLALLALLLSGGQEARAQAKVGAIGENLPRGATPRDLRGNLRPIHDFKARALVLVFAGTECPVSNLYLPHLIEWEKAYRKKEVQFLLVYPNENEDLDQVAAHASDRDVPFPALKDVGQKLAGNWA